MLQALRKLFGSKHERDIRSIKPIVQEINTHCERLKDLSDDELRAKTGEFRGRLQAELKETMEQLAELRAQLVPDLEGPAREQILEKIADLEDEQNAITDDFLRSILPEA